ncbi:C-C motif chemokine 20 [Aulostomus maculatus]
MAKLAVCVSLLLLVLAAQSESKPVKVCCTKYQQNEVPVKALKFYTILEDTGFCNLKAVIFMTKRKGPLCADPEKEWVKRAMETVPRLPSSTRTRRN